MGIKFRNINIISVMEKNLVIFDSSKEKKSHPLQKVKILLFIFMKK